MSLRTLEKAILKEARSYTGIPNLKFSDIIEWSSAEICKHDGEVNFLLPKLRIYIALKKKD